MFPGSTLSDHCLRYQNIPEIKMIVVLGELGGQVRLLACCNIAYKAILLVWLPTGVPGSEVVGPVSRTSLIFLHPFSMRWSCFTHAQMLDGRQTLLPDVS